jgi:hypothetical protein
MNACSYLRGWKRKSWLGILLFLLATGFSSTAPAQSSTAVLQATCTSLSLLNLTFSPGLGLLPQPTQLVGQTSGISCTYLSDLSVHQASLVNLQGSGNFSCSINTGASGSMEMKWDDGATSQISWKTVQIGNLNLPAVQRIFVMQGVVQSGKFAGDSLVLSYNDIPSINYLDCLTGYPLGGGGLTYISGLPTATITGLSLP